MKIKFIIILLLCSKTLFGQVVLLVHLNQKENIQNNQAIVIEEELKIGSYIIKYYKRLNKNNQLILDERTNAKGEFIARYIYKYDSLKSLKTTTIKEFVNESGEHYFNTEKYEYDNEKNLIKVVYLHNNNSISSTITVSTNANGHPVKLEEFNSNQILTSSTLIRYNYEENRAYYSKLDNNGEETNSGFFVIDYAIEKNAPKDGFEYNKQGDLVKTPKGYSEINYDRYGNWTTIKGFNIIDGKAKLNQEQNRIINYKK